MRFLLPSSGFASLFIIGPDDDLPKRIQHLRLPILLTPGPFPVFENVLLAPGAHFVPAQPLGPVGPHAAPSASAVPPRLSALGGRLCGRLALRAADECSQQGAGVRVVPEFGPPCF